ncbi:MAG TPA: ABC transporter substrate-binding protein, partial [Mycobacterium sp.]|nr:ABC transporter substrate-binding protein [Mycobacterium sp.]
PLTPPAQSHQPPVHQRPPPPASRDVSTYPSAYYIAHAVGDSASVDVANLPGASQQYQAQSFSHAHGTTAITSAPRAVAALGPGDGDAALALGIQLVAIGASGGQLPCWEERIVTGAPKVLGFIDTAAVGVTEPDVIIATGDIDEATYTKLSAIAPTITRPDGTAGRAWKWPNQLTWIGRILGRQNMAADLIDSARSRLDDLRNQHPAFDGKTIAAVYFSDTGTAAALCESNITDYLHGLGFRYSPDLQRGPGDLHPVRLIADPDKLYLLKTDVLVVVRTDTAAGRGRLDGLPVQFTGYRGDMVIVDDPDITAALADPGGYLATEFLNSMFVEALARQMT